MPTSYYLPAADDARAKWLTNFAAKLPAYAKKYAITKEELDAVTLGEQWFTAILAFQEQFFTFARNVTAFKDALRNGLPAGQALSELTVPTPALPATAAVPGVFGSVVAVVNKIKVNPAYTAADGTDLGVEGAQVQPRLSADLCPVLTVGEAAGGHPEVKWKKQNMPQLELQVDRGEGKGWEHCGTYTKASTTDKHALPAPGKSAVWSYRGIYHQHDEAVGQWSNAVAVTVMG